MYCVKFKDVFPFIKNGANIKQDANAGGIPITRIETLAGGEFNTSRLGYANIFDISPYYEYVLNSGDILMSHINSPEYLGRAVVFEDKYDIVIHGMNLLRLKANKELIDSRYAVYLFSGNIFKEYIRKITKKSVNQASFSINDLKEIELQLPSIENQVIIAEKLDKLKMLIKKKNRLILFLDEMIKSRFVGVFGIFNVNTNNHNTIKFKDLIEQNNINEEDEVWLLNLDMIKSNTGEIIEKVYINRQNIPTSSIAFKKGTVLYSKLRPYLNKVVIADENGYGTSELIPLNSYKNGLTAEYLAYYLRQDSFVEYIKDKVTGAKMPRVAMDILRNIDIIQPNYISQEQFSSFVNHINKLKFG